VCLEITSGSAFECDLRPPEKYHQGHRENSDGRTTRCPFPCTAGTKYHLEAAPSLTNLSQQQQTNGGYSVPIPPSPPLSSSIGVKKGPASKGRTRGLPVPPWQESTGSGRSIAVFCREMAGYISGSHHTQAPRPHVIRHDPPLYTPPSVGPEPWQSMGDGHGPHLVWFQQAGCLS